MLDIQTDDRGVEYITNGDAATLPRGWALCLTCYRAWNDEKSTGVTPAPSGRCPFEYDHEPEPDDEPAPLIQTTDHTIAFVLNPTQARALLDRMNGNAGDAGTIAPLHEALADFVFGDDDA